MTAKSTLSVSLAVLAIALAATPASKTTAPTNAAAAFEKLKTLAGEWQADTPMGKATSTYEVIAHGSALVERETIGGHPPMMTVFHLDGGKLVLTHYCMTGNQPRMEAAGLDPQNGHVDFKFSGISNLSSPNSVHMRNARYMLTDATHFTTEWDLFENAKLKNTEKFNYVRVK